MRLAHWRLLLVNASLLLVPAAGWADDPAEKTVAQLQRDVEERQRQALRAQRELSEARARLAVAEGDRAVAIRELRQVVTGYQAEVQWIRDHANWFCDPRDLMSDALCNTAKAQVRLAELEGDHAVLITAWTSIVGFHEQQLERVHRLEQLGAAHPDDRISAQQALDHARAKLSAAEKKLAESTGDEKTK